MELLHSAAYLSNDGILACGACVANTAFRRPRTGESTTTLLMAFQDAQWSPYTPEPDEAWCSVCDRDFVDINLCTDT